MTMCRPPGTLVETPVTLGRMVEPPPKTLVLLVLLAGDVTCTGAPLSKVKKLPTLHPPTTCDMAPLLTKGLPWPKGSSYWPLSRITSVRSCCEMDRSQEGQLLS